MGQLVIAHAAVSTRWPEWKVGDAAWDLDLFGQGQQEKCEPVRNESGDQERSTIAVVPVVVTSVAFQFDVHGAVGQVFLLCLRTGGGGAHKKESVHCAC